MAFFVVEFKIYRNGEPAHRRLFRPNVPAIEATERWVHCKVPHRDPEALVRARPDVLFAGGLRLPTRGGDWIFDGELSVWRLEASPSPEHRAVDWPMHLWTPGRYQGEPSNVYRLPAAQGEK